MKKISSQILSILLLIVVMFSLVGCGETKDETPTIKCYQVSLIDGDNVDTKSYEINTTITLVNYEKDGYIFEGWFKDLNKTDGPYTSYQASTEIQINFYAKWTSYDEIDKAAAQPIIDAINALPNPITLNDEATINKVLTSYNTLNDNAKSKVTNLELLNNAVETITLLKQTAEDAKVVKAVIDLINALPSEITLNDEGAINKANQAFQALSETLQPDVLNVSILNQAISIIDTQKLAVNKVISSIGEIIPDITMASEPSINNARALYEALSTISKTFVTNYEDLVNYEINLQEIKNAIAAVISAIDEIEAEITMDSEETILKALTLYNELTAESKTFITNYDVLVEAERQFQELNNRDVEALMLGINTLPRIITYNDKIKVEELVSKYESLTPTKKAKITNYSTLTAAVNSLNNIETDISQITYCLGDNVYESKTALFESFFTDFYYFILSQNGDARLRGNNINTVADFLRLASDMNGGGTTNMRGIGNIAGEFLLARDLNGIAADQPTNKFIGFCVQNGLYEDLIPFFIRFFAYWRIDERYATLDNYGADFFAEAWAPTVDIGKFFYYDENTSYVKTERMIDCFVNIAGVVYGNLPKYVTGSSLTLPTDIKLRGYKFMGWYNNPEFTGNPILTIEENHSKVILYAKWEIDKVQKDKDAAELVDVYIYNLLPSKANPTKANVEKIRDMYIALSSEAKILVTRYNTLVEYENKFQNELTNLLTISIIINKPNLYSSFDTMKSDFLSDFNRVTESSITYSDFTNNRYSIMKKIAIFYSNDEMYTKWSFILNYFIETDNSSRGLVIQANRAINRQSGDLEYVSKAIDGFFNSSNLTSDSEMGVDFSNSRETVINTNFQKKLLLSYTNEAYLPSLVVSGYHLIGYATNEQGTGDIYTKVTDDTPTLLYAIFKIN